MDEESLTIFIEIGKQLGYSKEALTTAYWHSDCPTEEEQKIITDIQHFQIDKCVEEIERTGFHPHF